MTSIVGKYTMMYYVNFTFAFVSFITYLVFSIISLSNAEEKLLIKPNKTTLIYLDQSASVVTVKNPIIADVDVKTPRKILVSGKTIGTTTISIIFKNSRKTVRIYDVVVTPWVDNKVTVNLGTDEVKTLKCQPRCIPMDNPGKTPAVSKSAGGKTGGGLPFPPGKNN
jgi:hypothetical protein